MEAFPGKISAKLDFLARNSLLAFRRKASQGGLRAGWAISAAPPPTSALSSPRVEAPSSPQTHHLSPHSLPLN